MTGRTGGGMDGCLPGKFSAMAGRGVRMLWVMVAIVWSTSLILAEGQLVLDENLKILNAARPDERRKFAGSNVPGQLFFPGEPVDLDFDFAREDNGAGYAIELQEITTRDPDSRTNAGFTDTSGNAPRIAREGAPIQVPLEVNFTDAPRVQFGVRNFPLPEKFGTYAMILMRGDGQRQFLGTLARVPRPRPDGTVDNVPIFGEGALIGDDGSRSEYYARMGVRGWRKEVQWMEKEDGTTNWEDSDKMFGAAKKLGCQIMATLGSHPEWSRPFQVPTPAAKWTPQTNGYGGTGDWLCRPELFPRYGQWLEGFVKRYWEGGKGGLWGLENYNEPWEGGGISGWAGDMPRYRALQKLVATSAREVDPAVRILASSSIMNTEDKLYSDGTLEMDPYIDIFTDHYVIPVNCYGPMVARARGKGSMETETWFVNSEYSLPQGAVQFLAAGQTRLSPWHPRVLFDSLPGVAEKAFIPTPVTVATAAFNHFVTGKRFEKMLFLEHLPFAFQFGKDDDKDAVVILFGRLMPVGSDDFKVHLWAQVNSTLGGTMTIDNHDGLLEFFDPAGNRIFRDEKEVTIPLSFLPTYLRSSRGPAAIKERLAAARIEGKRFVEIIPRDFEKVPDSANCALRVSLVNRLNRKVSGALKVHSPEGLSLESDRQEVTMGAGEMVTLDFPIKQAAASASNAYPFRFEFSSPDGNAEYAETLNAAVAPRGSKTVDGNLDDWSGVPGITVVGMTDNANMTELLRRPWLEVQKGNPETTSGEFKLAWDDDYLYVAARVNDPTAEPAPLRFSERDENSYFHSAASDTISPYKEFIEGVRARSGDPKRSFAEVPFVYCRSPEDGIPFRRDRLQFGLDVKPGWHDMQPVTGVSYGFHAVPDTDYEYSLYWVNDGKNGSAELWRYLAPGVPRINDWPRQVRGERTTGPVPNAKAAVRRDGPVYVYEAAIPREELKEFEFKAGTVFGLALVAGNSDGKSAYYAPDKAATKRNGLTLHPYWEHRPSAGVRWTLGE